MVIFLGLNIHLYVNIFGNREIAHSNKIHGNNVCGAARRTLTYDARIYFERNVNAIKTRNN